MDDQEEIRLIRYDRRRSGMTGKCQRSPIKIKDTWNKSGAIEDN